MSVSCARMPRRSAAPLAALAVLALAVSSAPAHHSAVAGMTIAVDPGHNGRNWAHPAEINRLVDAGTLRKACDTTGTATASGYTEPAFTFDVAVRLRRILRRAGADVVLTRSSNAGWGPCITERAAIGNRARADAAVSIHADGGPASGRGFHVIYPASVRGLTDDIATTVEVPRARRAARVPSRHGAAACDLSGRKRALGAVGPRRAQPLGRAQGVRGDGKHAEPADARLLESPSFRERIARAIAAGLDAIPVPLLSPSAARQRDVSRASFDVLAHRSSGVSTSGSMSSALRTAASAASRSRFARRASCSAGRRGPGGRTDERSE